MRMVQKSLDGAKLVNTKMRKKQLFDRSLFSPHSQAYESMYTRNSPWIEDVKSYKGISEVEKKDFLNAAVPGLAKSKNYYMKYIHEENNHRVRVSNDAVQRFIPQNRTEKKTYD